MNMKTITTLLMLAASLTFPIVGNAGDVTPSEARAIAKEAYVSTASRWWTVIASNTATSLIKKDPEYKGPWNEIHNTARVYTPADTAIQTPNSDTPYSFLGMDLRAEPLVLTVPPIEKERYFQHPAHRRLHLQFRLHRQPRHR